MKIGIFGGSFNPPHNMHKNIALELVDKGYIDIVIYVPTGDSYNKKDLISFIHRLNMVELMIQNNDNLLLSDIGNSENYQYTYQVLDYFRTIYEDSEIYFICGSDNLKEFDTWKNYLYILKNYRLLVIKRNNDDIDSILNKYMEYMDRIIIADIDSRVLSSTYLRDNMGSDEIEKYIDSDVYEYIKENGMYTFDHCKRLKCS